MVIGGYYEVLYIAVDKEVEKKNNYYGVCEWFLIWCTTINAPVTYGLNEAGLSEFLEAHIGKQTPEELEIIIAEAKLQENHETLLERNQASFESTHLPLIGIIEQYCKAAPKKNRGLIIL